VADQHPLSSLACMLIRHRADPCPADCSSPPRTPMREPSVVRATCVSVSKNPHLWKAEFEVSSYDQSSKIFLQIPVFASWILAHLRRKRSHSSLPRLSLRAKRSNLYLARGSVAGFDPIRIPPRRITKCETRSTRYERVHLTIACRFSAPQEFFTLLQSQILRCVYCAQGYPCEGRVAQYFAFSISDV
jgi:hypothetical protein